MSPAEREKALKDLNILRIVAIADFLLFIPLVICSSFVLDKHAAVSVLGPVHGVGFLGMLYLTAKGAGEGHWGWWFPAIVVITGGPIGSVVGDIKARKDLTAPVAV